MCQLYGENLEKMTRWQRALIKLFRTKGSIIAPLISGIEFVAKTDHYVTKCICARVKLTLRICADLLSSYPRVRAQIYFHTSRMSF